MIPRTKTVGVALFVVVSLPTAAGADALYDDISACRSVPSAEARLACYDGAADRVRTPPPPADPPPAAETAAAAPAAAAAAVSQEELFGKNADEVQRTVEEATGSERIETLTAQVTALQQAAPDKVVISLDNGQVWRQTTSSSLRLRTGDDIEIERGALGSYLLQKVGSKKTMRVQRVD